MASKVVKKKRKAEIEGGDVPKQRPLQRRIRDARRLLAREQLPETVRLTQERVLKSLEHELGEKLEEKRTKKISKKYRMVKFFEKRKVSRKLKTQMKLFEDCAPEKRAAMMETIARLRMELNYIVHFPEDSKYLALYPSTETTSAGGLALRENRMAATAEAVRNGELPDASLSFCSSDLPSIESQGEVKPRSLSKGRTIQGSSKSKAVKKTKDLKVAAVDRDSDSDDMESNRKLGDDDFFLDVTGSTN